jgi:exonuclease III
MFIDALERAGLGEFSQGLRWSRKIDGRQHMRILNASTIVRRAIKRTVSKIQARVKWESGGPPSCRAHTIGQSRYKNVPKKPKLRVGTWNINRIEGKRWEVVDSIKSMKLGIVALQETGVKPPDWPIRIPSLQIFERHFNESVSGARGLLIGVDKQYPSHLVDSTDHWVIVKAHGITNKPWFIVNAYLPHDRITKRMATNSLRDRIARLKRHDDSVNLIVLGDLNLSPKRAATLFPCPIDVHKLSVAGSNKTFHRGGKWTALDHILAARGTLPLLKKARVKRKYEVSDHFPLVTKIKLPETPQIPGLKQKPRLASDKLAIERDAIINDGLWSRWLNRWSGSNIQDPKSFLNRTADYWDRTVWWVAKKHNMTILPKPPKFKKISPSVRRAIRDKRSAWKLYYEASPATKEASFKTYKSLRRTANKAIREQQKTSWLDHIAIGAKYARAGHSRKFFRWVDNFTKYRGRIANYTHPIQDDDGQMHYMPRDIAELWAQHYETLFKEERTAPILDMTQEVGDPLEGINAELSWSEVQATIKSMKSHKAPGPNGITAEWFKLMIDPVREGEPSSTAPSAPMQIVFLKIINMMWQLAYIPEKWTTAELVSIPKKGDLTVRDNYRGIALIDVSVKILTKLIVKRITEEMHLKDILAKEQAGFRYKEECMGQAISLLDMLHRRKNVLKKGTALLFVDFRKAYDLVNHQALLFKLEQIGVNGRALNFIRALYTSSSISVKTGSEKSRVIKVEKGCRQGCPGSPILFDIYINDLVPKINRFGVEVPGIDAPMGTLLFADDLIVICPNIDQLKEACEELDKWADSWGMQVGIQKCGLMIVDDADMELDLLNRTDSLCLQGMRIPMVEKYSYLGITLTKENPLELVAHISERAEKFRKRCSILEPYLRSHSIPTWMRRQVFLSVCVPILKWGAEAMGPGEAAIKNLTSAYDTTLKMLCGSRSKNTIFSAMAVRRELGLKSVQQMIIESRVRLLLKAPNLKTWIKDMVQQPASGRKLGWAKRTNQWLKSYPKIDLSLEGDHLGQLKRYFKNKDDAHQREIKYQEYLQAQYETTNEYLKKALEFPQYSKGCNWLFRARVKGIWSVKHAISRNLIRQDIAGKCPACREIIVEDELVHIMLDCQKYNEHRDLLSQKVELARDAGFDSKSILILLLGGLQGENPAARPWTARQWMQGIEQNNGEGGEPVFIKVAEFLQRVMPKHMASLWSYQIVTPIEMVQNQSGPHASDGRQSRSATSVRRA